MRVPLLSGGRNGRRKNRPHHRSGKAAARPTRPEASPQARSAFAGESKSSTDHPVAQRTLRLHGSTRISDRPGDVDALAVASGLVRLAGDTGLSADLWEAQKKMIASISDALPSQKEKAGSGDLNSARWIERLSALGGLLHLRVH